MQIERDGDVIRYRLEDPGSDGIIGGVVGTLSAVQIADNAALERYWAHCARQLQPNPQTVEAVIRWAEQTWDLQPLPPHHMKMVVQRAGIACQLFPDQYGDPPISPEMSDQEIEDRIVKGHARRQAAMAVSDEDLGICLRGYHLPDTPRNRPLYKQAAAAFHRQMEEQRQWMMEHHPDHPLPPLTPEHQLPKADGYLFIEETQGRVSGVGMGAAPLVQMLGKRMGVSAKDIADRTPRFLAYVHGLTEEGTLPTLQQFLDGEANRPDSGCQHHGSGQEQDNEPT